MKIIKIHFLAVSVAALLGLCFSTPAKAQDLLEYQMAGTGTLAVPLYSLPNDPSLDVPLYSVDWTGRVETNNVALSGNSTVSAVLRPNAETGAYDVVVEATSRNGLVVPLYSIPGVVRGGACLPFPHTPR